MSKYLIKTHRPGTIYQGNYFFIQSKGFHSGKPLKEPYPNCFVCLCISETSLDEMYWLLFILWQGRKFHEVLVGSVIPFIRIKDLQDLVQLGLDKFEGCPQQFYQTVESLKKLQQQELNYFNINDQIGKLKMTLVSRMFA
jgi:hypothetical protein